MKIGAEYFKMRSQIREVTPENIQKISSFIGDGIRNTKFALGLTIAAATIGAGAASARADVIGLGVNTAQSIYSAQRNYQSGSSSMAVGMQVAQALYNNGKNFVADSNYQRERAAALERSRQSDAAYREQQAERAAANQVESAREGERRRMNQQLEDREAAIRYARRSQELSQQEAALGITPGGGSVAPSQPYRMTVSGEAASDINAPMTVSGQPLENPSSHHYYRPGAVVPARAVPNATSPGISPPSEGGQPGIFELPEPHGHELPAQGKPFSYSMVGDGANGAPQFIVMNDASGNAVTMPRDSRLPLDRQLLQIKEICRIPANEQIQDPVHGSTISARAFMAKQFTLENAVYADQHPPAAQQPSAQASVQPGSHTMEME